MIKIIKKKIKFNRQLFSSKISSFEYNSADQIQKCQHTQMQKQYKSSNIHENQLQNFELINQKHRLFEKMSADECLAMLKHPKILKKEKYIEKTITLITLLHQHKKLMVYERPEIIQNLEFICQNLHNISEKALSAFAISLIKMQIRNETFYQNLIVVLDQRKNQLSIRTIANCLYSFNQISKIENNQIDYYETFRNLETTIALKLRSNMDIKAVLQIVTTFSKLQTLSNEFLFFIDKITYDHFDHMKPQEITNLLYTFSKNNYESHQLLEKTRTDILKNSPRYKIQDLSLCLYSFAHFNCLDQLLLSKFDKEFILKSEHSNIQDVSLFCQQFFLKQFVTPQFYNSMTTSLQLLQKNINQDNLVKLFTNFSMLLEQQKIKKQFTNILYNAFQNLQRKDKLTSKQLQFIKNQIQDIKDKEIKEKFQKILQ